MFKKWIPQLTIIVPFSIFLSLASPALRASNAITWQTIHFPPLMILRGPDKGSGQLDHFLPYLQKQLPQYQHRNSEVNWARIFKSIEHGKNMCSNMVFKTTEREDIAEFSVPVAVALPIRIIMSKENKALIGNPTSYSLSKLIIDNRFKGALVNDRSYTPAIDKLLKRNQGSTNIERKAITSESLLTMLQLNRISYMIEYPATVSYLTRNNKDFKNQFSSIAIDEISPFTLTYLACPKNAWGKKVVDDINKIIIEKHSSDEYIQLISRYYNSDEVKLIRKGLKSAIKPKSKLMD